MPVRCCSERDTRLYRRRCDQIFRDNILIWKSMCFSRVCARNLLASVRGTYRHQKNIRKKSKKARLGMIKVVIVVLISNLFDHGAAAALVSRSTLLKYLVSFLPAILQTAIIAFAATVFHRVVKRRGDYIRMGVCVYQDTHHDIYDDPACKPFSNLCRDKYCKSLSATFPLADISVWKLLRLRVNHTRLLLEFIAENPCEKCHAMRFSI